MKVLHIFLTGLVVFSMPAEAQYRINKKVYDQHGFTYQKSDPYQPAIAGFSSLIMPGSGQMMCGEVVRGFCIIGGIIGSGAVTFTGLVYFASAFPTSEWEHVKIDQAAQGLGIMFIGFISFVSIDIWSAVDASRVAKVNNRAFRDRVKTSGMINIQPYMGTSDYTVNKKTPVGISCKIIF
jgi:hypothetical protein